MLSVGYILLKEAFKTLFCIPSLTTKFHSGNGPVKIALVTGIYTFYGLSIPLPKPLLGNAGCESVHAIWKVSSVAILSKPLCEL